MSAIVSGAPITRWHVRTSDDVSTIPRILSNRVYGHGFAPNLDEWAVGHIYFSRTVSSISTGVALGLRTAGMSTISATSVGTVSGTSAP